MEIKADVIDYMGKMDGGVIVLLSINFDGEFSEGTIFYTDDNLAITVSEEVEKKLGCEIELWEGYAEFVTSILLKLTPCSEIIDSLEEVDFSKYIQFDGETRFVEDEIDPDDIEEA